MNSSDLMWREATIILRRTCPVSTKGDVYRRQVINRWHTDSEKYDGLKKFAPKAPDNSIPLWIADMDFKTAPEIIAAMHKRVDEGIFGYTDIYDASYYQAVCHWMEKRHHWHITPDEIVVDSGVVPALSHALSLIARPGDGVIIHTPAYKPFFNSIRNTGMIPVYTRLCCSHGLFTIDFEDLEQKADRKSTRLNSSHITRSRMPSSA